MTNLRAWLLSPKLFQIWRREFQDYNLAAFRRDVLAGVTVTAVSLPLALAFGVASGASAAAGVVTAILAGLIVGILSGAGYQISGPTSTTVAVLVILASRYGLQGVWIASVMSGVFVLLLGLFNLGQIVNFIPSAVIVGFTSGNALTIFIGQLDNLLGTHTPVESNSLLKLLNFFHFDYAPNLIALGLSLLVIAIMILWPKRLNARFPGSLLALIVVTAVAILFNLNVPTIGTIPQTILLDQRLTFGNIPWTQVPDLIAPALSLAALVAIESLLCGTVAERMTDAKMVSSQVLIAHGVGNIVIPFFGGLPASAVIARTSLAIKSGGRTRVMSIVQALTLLAIALALAPLISRVPMAVLAGVLAVTCWRMNDWAEIRDIFHRHFKSAMFAFISTVIATIALDLTSAIILGIGLSALIFVFQSSRGTVAVEPVSVERMRADGYEMQSDAKQIVVAYIGGPLFFGTVNEFNMALEALRGSEDLILSMRTVPLLDTTGIRAIEALIAQYEREGRRIYLSGLTDPVRSYLTRAGIIAHLGEDNIFWSAYEAILAADRYRASLHSLEEDLVAAV
jgi:SulP family sulfate permease